MIQFVLILQDPSLVCQRPKIFRKNSRTNQSILAETSRVKNQIPDDHENKHRVIKCLGHIIKREGLEKLIEQDK